MSVAQQRPGRTRIASPSGMRKNQKKERRAVWSTILGRWISAGGTVMIVLALAFRVHYRFTVVVGESMLPTLKPGDLLLVDKGAYNHAEPSRGDIVVVRYLAGFVVKRVVGLPGEEVEVRHGRLYINGGLIKENHRVDPGHLHIEQGSLLDGDFATLGDNRAVVPALAVHPIVTKADILGKVVLALGKSLR